MPSPHRTCIQIAVCSLVGLTGAAPAANAQGFTIFTIAYATSANAATVFPITWSGGNPGMTVNVFLMKKSPYSKVMTLAANIANSGSFNWTVPSAGGGIVCGHEYAISVTRLATPTTNTLGPWFTLECSGSTAMTIFTITYATSANTANIFPIKWSGGTPGMTVNLFLMKKTPYSNLATLAANIPNSGSFTWVVPSAGGSIVCGHEYAISVTRLATPTTNTLGPWFTMGCGAYNIRVQLNKIGSNSYLAQVSNGAGPALELPVGAHLELGTIVPAAAGVRVNATGSEWNCPTVTALGSVNLSCSRRLKATVGNNALLTPVTITTTGAPNAPICVVTKLSLNIGPWQFFNPPDSNLNDNQACAQ